MLDHYDVMFINSLALAQGTDEGHTEHNTGRFPPTNHLLQMSQQNVTFLLPVIPAGQSLRWTGMDLLLSQLACDSR